MLFFKSQKLLENLIMRRVKNSLKFSKKNFPLSQVTLKLTGAFLSIGLMINFLSLKEMFLISLQGNPIFGVSLDTKSKSQLSVRYFFELNYYFFLMAANQAKFGFESSF